MESRIIGNVAAKMQCRIIFMPDCIQTHFAAFWQRGRRLTAEQFLFLACFVFTFILEAIKTRDIS